MLLANNEDCLSWNEFLDALDTEPELPLKLTKLLEQNRKNQELFENLKEEDKESKKA
jgi:hypothetical protein